MLVAIGLVVLAIGFGVAGRTALRPHADRPAVPIRLNPAPNSL